MYKIDKLNELAKVVAAKRAENAALEPRRMTAEEKDELLAHFHPDYKQEEFTVLSAGVNKGDKVPTQLAELLQGKSRISASDVDLTAPDYETDVLIIGGGGAGASAAIEADEAGVKAMIVTKLRIGDANTMMAEGGIQAADKPNDSPAIHFLDAFGGGHFAAKPELVKKLVTKAPEAIQWLNKLGVEFDKEPDGTMVTTHGGGTSRKRMHAAKDYSGAEIMRTLRDEVINRGIPVIDFTAAIEIILDENGRAAGAVLMNMETKEVVGAEALARWEHHDKGLLSPAVFIPIMEKNGFVSSIDYEIWNRVVEWISVMKKAGKKISPISVNVSRADIYALDVAEVLKELCDRYGVPYDAIEAEITETAYMEHFERINSTVEKLHKFGFSVSMDDFGSGYSSLNALKNMNVDALKIDMRFLDLNKENSEKGIGILEGVLNMAKTLALPTIVEGVETEEQSEMLRKQGCDMAQGYYYYRPMPVDEYEKSILK